MNDGACPGRDSVPGAKCIADMETGICVFCLNPVGLCERRTFLDVPICEDEPDHADEP